MALIFKNGPHEIWQVTEGDVIVFYVYGYTRDPKVCPSLDMARAYCVEA